MTGVNDIAVNWDNGNDGDGEYGIKEDNADDDAGRKMIN